MRGSLALAVATVVVAAAHAKVQVLEGGDMGESTQVQLGVGTMVHMKAFATRMWTKMDANVPPQGTVTYKTLKNVEPHGKCRFACYQDKMCGGYAYTPASYTCQLLSAPNFLTDKAANDRWHKEVAFDHTGADYEPDQEVEKEEESMKEGLKQVPKKPASKKDPPKKAGDEGHMNLDLERVMNDALEEDATESSNTEENMDTMSDGTLAKLKGIKANLYQEFYERYAHEYEQRAEAMAARKAHKIADKRIKKHNLIHPKDKIKGIEGHKLYLQARKEVDDHAISKMQRAFQTRLSSWGAEKMYEEQERLKNEKDEQERKATEEEEAAEEKLTKQQVEGKAPSFDDKEGGAAEEQPAGNKEATAMAL